MYTCARLKSLTIVMSLAVLFCFLASRAMSPVFLRRLFNTCILLHLAAFEHEQPLIHLCRDWHVIMKICLDELLFKAHESL